MNLLKNYLISIFLIVFLVNTAFGFAGMGGNTTIAQNMTIPQETAIQKPQDIKNATSSDQDIIMAQHLIEYDAVQLQSENKLFIRETLIFRNIGTKDFYGPLRTWLPDGYENKSIKVSKSEMMTGGGLDPVNNITINGNIISWEDNYVEQNSKLPLIYAVEYIVSMKPGESSLTGTLSKKLAYPTLLNYRYVEKPGLPGLVVKILKPQESSIKIFDENRNEIKGEVDETGNLYRFSSPQFKELNIEISKSSAIPAAVKQDYVVYVVIGLLIVLVLLYPYISKKLKQEESGKTSKVTSSSSVNKPREERSGSNKNPVRSEGDLKGNSDTEMDPLRKELGLKLKELETKYKSGDLLDEEYEDEKKAIQNKLKSMNKGSK